MSFMDRVKASYNVLMNKDPTLEPEQKISSTFPSSSFTRLSYDTTQAILAPIQTRIAIDVASIPIKHIRVDEDDQFVEVVNSELNDRLTISANVDQTGAAFIQDSVMTILGDGAAAQVPVQISGKPGAGSYDILSMRVGTISTWNNYSVYVNVYNELVGEREEVLLPKSFVAITYNPLYAVMNEANSTLTRLKNRLALLDVADSNLFSPGLDLIIQLPYVIKGDKRVEEAQRRLDELEEQLNDRKMGIGYINPTEKITQLNRPATNMLFETVTSLTESLHTQLGLTQAIFRGEATQEELMFYNNRTVFPIARALCDSMTATFFSRTAIKQGHRVRAFPSLFTMAPLPDTAEAVDKLTRNAIMTSNEVRSVFMMKPSKDPDADALRNKNLNQSDNPGNSAKQEIPNNNKEQDENDGKV